MTARDDFTPADDEVARLRVPPHSVQAEHAVLGCVMLDPASLERVGDLVTERDFYRHENRLVFAACVELAAKGKPCDVVSVLEHLQATGRESDAGGLPYLNALAMCVPSAANACRYAEIVREKAQLRAAIAAADNLATAAFNTDGRELPEIVEEALGALTGIATRAVTRLPKRMGDIARSRLDHFDALARGEVSQGWATGLQGLDRLLGGGLRPGGLYILAARPKVGKSSLALRLAGTMAARDLPSLVLSQEMPDAEIADREIAQTGAIDYGRIVSGRITGDDWGRLAEAAQKIAALPLYVDDEPALTLSAIRAKARAVPGLRVLVLDYLQLCAGSGKRRDETRSGELEEITRGLKALAKSMGIAILALSQLNREVEKRANKRPVLSDLRDSGAIEQDADVVLMLWPHQGLDNGQKLIGCAIEANRQGPSGTLVLHFDGVHQRWGESNVTLRDHVPSPGGFE